MNGWWFVLLIWSYSQPCFIWNLNECGSAHEIFSSCRFVLFSLLFPSTHLLSLPACSLRMYLSTQNWWLTQRYHYFYFIFLFSYFSALWSAVLRELWELKNWCFENIDWIEFFLKKSFGFWMKNQQWLRLTTKSFAKSKRTFLNHNGFFWNF